MSLICSDSALRGLHHVLIRARFQALENAKTNSFAEVMAEAMDVAEYLVAILQNHEGLTEEEGLERFRLYLKDLETRIPGFSGVTAVFDASAFAATEKQSSAAYAAANGNAGSARNGVSQTDAASVQPAKEQVGK